MKTNDVRRSASTELDAHQREIKQTYTKAAVGHKYIATLDREVILISAHPHLTRLGLIERLGYLYGKTPKFGVLVRRPSGRYAQLTGNVIYDLDQRSVKPLLGLKNGSGRPRILDTATPRTMYVRSADHIRLMEIGGGASASAGLRKLLDAHGTMGVAV